MDTQRRKSKKRSADPTDLRSVIRFFRKCERATVRGNVPLTLNLERLEELSTSEGLEPDDIIKLLDIAAAGSWPQTVSKKLIQCLIPRHHVPSEAAVKAVSWMCTNKPPPAIQALLIRWLVLVYELVDRKEDLQALYGFIFYFLENETMCSHVCHLLYLMTRKEDVRPVRIRALISLQQRMGDQAYLQGLMAIYKLYCPHLMAIALPSTRTVFFRQTDRPWSAKIRTVQNKRNEHEESDKDHTSALDSRLQNSISLAKAAKRQRRLIIPKAQESTQAAKRPFTYSAPLAEDDCTVPVSHVDSFKMFINNLHLLELPSRAASALENEFVCQLASLSGDRALPYRLSYWIHHALQEEFFHLPRSGNMENRQLLLDSLLYFTKYIQESIPVVESFLSQYLPVWNGQDHKTTLFKLVAHLNVCPFKALSALILQPLHTLYFSSSVYFKCQVIWMLTELLRNQLLVDWPRHKHTESLEADRLTSEDSYISNFHSMFRDDVEKFSAVKTISEVMSFVDQLIGVSLKLEQDHILLLHCCLSFYEMCISVALTLNIPLIHVMPHALVYHCLFTNNAAALSRLCSLFSRYRSSLGNLRTRQYSGQLQGELLTACEISRGHIPHFNQYTLDIAAALWQGQALLGRSRPDSVYQLFSADELAEKTDSTAKVAFTIYKHPGLLAYARQFAKDTESGQIPDIADVKNRRKVFLEFLSSHDVEGIPTFIEKFVRDRNSSSSLDSQ